MLRAVGPGLAALLLLQVASGVLVAPLITLLPVYVERRLGLMPDFSASLRVVSVVAGGVAALGGGEACRRLGVKRAFLLAMTGVVAAGLMFLVSWTPLLYALALYGGVMFGLGSVSGMTLVMELSPPGTLARATGAYFLSGTVGNVAGSAASGWLARELAAGYAVLGAAMSAGHLLLMLAAARLLPSAAPGAEPAPAGARQGGGAALLRRGDVLALLAVRFLPTVYWGVVTLAMPLALYRMTGSEKPAGYYTAANLAISAACQLGAGRIVDRVGVARPAVVAACLVALAAAGQTLFAHRAPGLIAFGLLGAGAAWSLSITMTTFIQGLSTQEERPRLLGLTHVAWSAGFVTGSWLGGRALSVDAAARPALVSAAVCCAAAVVSLGVVVRAYRRREGGCRAAAVE